MRFRFTTIYWLELINLFLKVVELGGEIESGKVKSWLLVCVECWKWLFLTGSALCGLFVEVDDGSRRSLECHLRMIGTALEGTRTSEVLRCCSYGGGISFRLSGM